MADTSVVQTAKRTNAARATGVHLVLIIRISFSERSPGTLPNAPGGVARGLASLTLARRAVCRKHGLEGRLLAREHAN